MIDWDDYHTPETPKVSTKPIEKPVEAPKIVSSTFASPESVSSHSEYEKAARDRLNAMQLLGTEENPFMGAERLKSSDKQVVRGNSDVNQLIPFKYDWAWQRYLDGSANHWMPQEIAMTKDIEQWHHANSFSDDERLMVMRTLGFFSTADTMVANNLVSAIYDNISAPEIRQYLLRQMIEEGIHCYVGGTEILTENGFVDFRQLKSYMKVAQYHDNGTIDFVIPKEVIRSPYQGNVISFSSNDGTYSSSVTPNHRCIVCDIDQSALPFAVLAEDVSLSNKLIPISGYANGKSQLRLSDMQRLQIAFQAEGKFTSITDTDLEQYISFTLKTEAKLNALLDLVKSLKLKFTVKSVAKTKHSLSITVPADVKLDKTFNWIELSEINSLWCIEFFNELSQWGNTTKDQGAIRYQSLSKEAVDTVMAIAALAGKSTKLSTIYCKDKSRETLELIIGNHSYQSGNDINKSVQHYTGEVHCVTVDTGMIIVRYNGCVTVSGNSHSYQYCIESLRMDQGEVFNMYREVAPIASKMSWALQHTKRLSAIKLNSDSPDSLVSDFMVGLTAYYAVVEGVFFYCGFAQLIGLGRRNLLSGTSQQIQYILRDESSHATFGLDLINQIKRENPECWTEEVKQRMLDLFMEGYLLECDYIKDTLPNGILGMNFDLHSTYLKFIIDRRCTQLGLPTLFGGNVVNPYPWLSEMMDLRKEANFFERREIICALAS